ncbi:phosphotransferase [Streptomyces sp. NPDC102467]|uniref:phosphotransferase n=1 Tax=Streptomyces sp. NPDC102467 TaxID=3366179 RepID=UPI003807E11E
MNSWERAERLDADHLTDALYERTGVRLTVEGPCSGGQVGAAYVRWAHGRRSVLKWRPRTARSDLESGPLAVCEALRGAGYPCPATELTAQVGHAVVHVQELLPGAPIHLMDEDGLDQVLALNDLQAGALKAHPGVPSARLYLTRDGPGFCLHEPLRRHSRRTAELERRVRDVGARHPDVLRGDDALHLDFHPGNLLHVDGRITGVVDWDGAARGDRRLDLVTLRFGLHAPGRQSGPGVVERLDALLDALPADVLGPAWAHMSLRMTDWAVRHFTPDEVRHWLDLAERRLG